MKVSDSYKPSVPRVRWLYSTKVSDSQICKYPIAKSLVAQRIEGYFYQKYRIEKIGVENRLRKTIKRLKKHQKVSDS